MKAAFKELYTGVKSLVTGMSLTLREFFKPTITVHYPHQTLRMPERFRGHIELTPNPDGGDTLCIACKSCEKACPSDCITVEGTKRETGSGKIANVFQLDFTTCSLCGLCIEACPVKPVKAIQFTKRYNLASQTNDYNNMDLLARCKERTPPKPAAPAPVAEAAPAAPSPAPSPAPAPAAQTQPQAPQQQ